MTDSNRHRDAVATLGLMAIGLLMLVIALFFDPVGESPDTGVVDLGTVGSKWLLGILGSAFIMSGVWSFLKNRR
jgi:hypothetical protein